MGSITRRIRRNMCEKRYGSRKVLSSLRNEARLKKNGGFFHWLFN